MPSRAPDASRKRQPVSTAQASPKAQVSRALPLHEPLAFEAVIEEESLRGIRAFEALMRRRRTVRDFAPDPVPREVIEAAIRIAGSAPSGGTGGAYPTRRERRTCERGAVDDAVGTHPGPFVHSTPHSLLDSTD